MNNPANKETIGNIIRSLSKPQIIVLVFAMMLGFINFLATDLYLPSMPSMTIALSATRGQIQATIAIFLLGSTATQLIFGTLSDRFGRRIILIVGLCISLGGFVLATFAFNIHTLLWARLIQGIGLGVAMPLFRALLCDVVSGKKLVIALSYCTMLFSLSPIIAPLAGSYIEEYLNWRVSFVFLFLIFGLYIFLAVRYCPETLKNRVSIRFSVLRKYYAQLFTHYKFIVASLVSGAGLGQVMAYITNASFIFQVRFHFSPVLFGWTCVVVAIATILGKLLNAKCALNLQVSTLILIGNCMTLVAGVWLMYFVHTQNVLLILLPLLLMVMSVGFTIANALVIAMKDFGHIRGTAGALYGVIQLSVGVIASAITAYYASHDVLILGMVFIVLSIFGLIATFTLRGEGDV